jgi:hypothetical protein
MALINIDDINKYSKIYADKYKDFPFQKITLESVKKDILRLENLQSESLILKEQDCLFTIKTSRVGNNISNYFFQKERMKVSVNNKCSPIDVMKNDLKREKIYSKMIKIYKSIDYNEMRVRRIIALYYCTATQFKVSTAKVIYDYFKAKNVFTKTYLGIDPNTQLSTLYQNLYDTYLNYSKFKDKKIEIITKAAEDVIITKKFDLIFSSPPYFNYEKYSNEEIQSNIRYKTLDDWLNKFLYKTINNNYNNLENQGSLVLHIKDYKTKNKLISIIEPLKNYIKTYYPNLNFKGYIKVQIIKRFIKDNEKFNYEYIYVWTKQID